MTHSNSPDAFTVALESGQSVTALHYSAAEPASGGTAVAEKSFSRATSDATTSGCSAATSKNSHGSAVTFHKHQVCAHCDLSGCAGGCGAPHLSV